MQLTNKHFSKLGGLESNEHCKSREKGILIESVEDPSEDILMSAGQQTSSAPSSHERPQSRSIKLPEGGCKHKETVEVLIRGKVDAST